MRLRPLVLLVLFPLLEVALLVALGRRIGVAAVLLLSLATAGVGIWLVRAQGRVVLGALIAALRSGRLPVTEAFHGAALAVAGLALMLPGLLSDLGGLALLIPGLRRRLYRWIAERIREAAGGERGDAPVLELEAVPVEEPGTLAGAERRRGA